MYYGKVLVIVTCNNLMLVNRINDMYYKSVSHILIAVTVCMCVCALTTITNIAPRAIQIIKPMIRSFQFNLVTLRN